MIKDPSNEFPRQEYVNKPTTNAAAIGSKKNKVYLGGGDHDVDLDLLPLQASKYGYNQVAETISGHITEIDDTPGAERIMFRHRTGAGVEMRADGTVIISSTNNTVRVCGGDEKVIIEGNGEISYNGNLKLNVSGDFELEVGGDYRVKTSGSVYEDIVGSYRQRVNESYKSIVTKHRSEFTGETNASTILGDHTSVIKGKSKNLIEGDYQLFNGGTLTMTAENTIVYSAPNINGTASKLVIIGDSGTLGGNEIVYYGKGATFEEGITAPTFHGALEGNAKTATQAGRAGTAGSLGAGGSAGTEVNVTTPTTVQPNRTRINNFLRNSQLTGVRDVDIDAGAAMKNIINRTADYGGVANRELTTAEIRSRLRDPNTANNTKFIGTAIAEGKLSSTFNQQTPRKTGRIINKDAVPKRGTKRFGNSSDFTKRYVP